MKLRRKISLYAANGYITFRQQEVKGEMQVLKDKITIK